MKESLAKLNQLTITIVEKIYFNIYLGYFCIPCN